MSTAGQRQIDGCVTNLDHGDQRLTIWRSGERYRLENFGGGAIHQLTYAPLFQSIAAEVSRLTCELGASRRSVIELRRQLLGEGIEPCVTCPPSDEGLYGPKAERKSE